MTEIDSYIIQTDHEGNAGHVREELTEASGYPFFNGLILLAQRKGRIAAVTVGATILGVIAAFALPVWYTSTTKLMTPQQAPSSVVMMANPAAMAGSAALASSAGGAFSFRNPNDLYVGLLSSRTITDGITREFDLLRVYGAKDMTAARKKLAAHTSISAERSGLLSISVTDRDKGRAAKIANAYTEQLRILTQTLAVTEAGQRRAFYETQLKLGKEDLINAQYGLQQIQQKKGMVQVDAQAKAVIGGLAELRGQIAAKEVQLRALQSYSTEKNPEVQLVENQLVSLRGQAAQMSSDDRSAGPGNLALQNVAASGLEYLRAEHEFQYRQTLYDLLVKQYDAARLDEAKEGAIIQVVEPAIEPDRRSSPPRVLIVLLSAAAGFLGACISILFGWWKESSRAGATFARCCEDLVRAWGAQSQVLPGVPSGNRKGEGNA